MTELDEISAGQLGMREVGQRPLLHFAEVPKLFARKSAGGPI